MHVPITKLEGSLVRSVQIVKGFENHLPKKDRKKKGGGVLLLFVDNSTVCLASHYKSKTAVLNKPINIYFVIRHCLKILYNILDQRWFCTLMSLINMSSSKGKDWLSRGRCPMRWVGLNRLLAGFLAFLQSQLVLNVATLPL